MLELGDMLYSYYTILARQKLIDHKFNKVSMENN